MSPTLQAAPADERIDDDGAEEEMGQPGGPSSGPATEVSTTKVEEHTELAMV